jgi:ATP-dependent RNA helicase SUPV3L1/SUV3
MCGYRNAGERMIRIDMLERLADMLRNEDSRGGFEAKPDMLSITGMTLEQFADLMQGLGYNADKGERVKAKPVDAVVTETGTPAADVPVMDAAQQAENTPAAAPDETDTAAVTEDNAVADVTPADVPAEVANIADAGAAPVAETLADAAASDPIPETAEIETPVGDAADAKVEEQEMEVFYTFTWGRARNAKGGQRGAGRRGQQAGDGEGRGGAKRGGDGPRGKGGKPRGGKPGKKGGPRQDQGSKTYSARPPKKEKQIDPDNPFAAALMGLKQGD